jgi:uncharacterized protein YaaR (DUF327 family)
MEDNRTRKTIETIKQYKKLLKRFKKEIINPQKLDEKIREELQKN